MKNTNTKNTKTLTVGAIISKNMEDLGPIIDKARFKEADDSLEKLLNTHVSKGELDSTSAKTCILELRKLENKPSTWMSTFVTWQLGGKYRVGHKKTY